MTTAEAAAAIAGAIFPADHAAHADCRAWLETQAVARLHAEGALDLDAAVRAAMDAACANLRARADVIAALGRDERAA